jgi:hypothetical protein
LLLLFSVSSFASWKKKKSSKKVKSGFLKKILAANPACLQLGKKEGFYFVRFIYQSVGAYAAYNEEGELLAVSRVIETKSNYH